MSPVQLVATKKNAVVIHVTEPLDEDEYLIIHPREPGPFVLVIKPPSFRREGTTGDDDSTLGMQEFFTESDLELFKAAKACSGHSLNDNIFDKEDTPRPDGARKNLESPSKSSDTSRTESDNTDDFMSIINMSIPEEQKVYARQGLAARRQRQALQASEKASAEETINMDSVSSECLLQQKRPRVVEDGVDISESVCCTRRKLRSD